MASERQQWILLAYRMPREPSTPRITVWRRLRRLGALQIGDGLVALPATPRTIEQLGWVANAVLDADGEATTWRAQLTSIKQEQQLIVLAREELAASYRQLEEESRSIDASMDRRVIKRIQAELARLIERDYFSAPGRDTAERAVSRLRDDAARISELRS